jgi:hypothetical protein
LFGAALLGVEKSNLSLAMDFHLAHREFLIIKVSKFLRLPNLRKVPASCSSLLQCEKHRNLSGEPEGKPGLTANFNR